AFDAELDQPAASIPVATSSTPNDLNDTASSNSPRGVYERNSGESDRGRSRDVEGRAFPSSSDREGFVGERRGRAEEVVEGVVVVGGVVVERHEMLDVREAGERDGVLQGAVSPSDALLVLGIGVLRVVDQHVRPGGDRKSTR